ncbi:MAG: hypothetical protein KA436_01570 [Oligoflexales bacterium]|nr:hypothetical protein [Oligoflexales bacterium]
MRNFVFSFIAVLFSSAVFAAPHASEEDHHHGHHGSVRYTAEHLDQAAQKGRKRFERLAIPHSKLIDVKTWKGSEYVWVKVIYSVPAGNDQRREEVIILACHPHGSELGCHKMKAVDFDDIDHAL